MGLHALYTETFALPHAPPKISQLEVKQGYPDVINFGDLPLSIWSLGGAKKGAP